MVNFKSLIFGMLLGMALLIGGSLYLEYQGAPTPASVCHDQLGEDYEPTAVDIDRENRTVYITCENATNTETVTEELNVMDDVNEGG